MTEPSRQDLFRLNGRVLTVEAGHGKADFHWWGWDSRKTLRIQEHVHSGWEAVLVTAGHGWFEHGGHRDPLAPGDLMLTPPGVRHAIRLDGRRPLALLYTRFDLRPDPGLRTVSAPVSAWELEPCFDHIVEELAAGSADGLQAAARLLLVRLLRRIDDAGSAQAADPLAAAEDRIESALHRPLSVAEIARAAGLGEKALARAMRARWGRSPLQEVMERRIRRACLLLAEGVPLAEVAARTAFPTVRHFIAVFRKRTGTTPGRWRDGGKPAPGRS